MKLRTILIPFFFFASLHAQTLVNVQKSGAPANAISGDLDFGSGRTLTLSTGSHLVLAAGTFSPAAGSIAWSALTGQPTTLAGYGITDPVVVTSGSYANPSWITSLAVSKLISGPISSALMPAFSGDATSSAGATVLTLAASGVTLGSYGSATSAPVITFDAKGRATAASIVTITPAFSSLTSTPTSAASYGITNGANIDAWGAKTIPAGTIADLASSQVFTNKSISGAANTITNIPLATAVTGILPATSHPALTGDVTVTSGTTVTAYSAVVPSAKGGAGAVTGLLKANGSGVVSAAVSGTDFAAPGSYITALTGDGTAAGPGSSALTITKLNGTSLAGLTTGLLKNTTGTGVPTIAAAGTDYQTPLTISTGLTNSSGTVTVNTSQNIAKLSNLTTNGFVKTGSGDGTLSVDTASYITGNQTITLSGDATGSGTTAITVTNGKINGISLAGLATGVLKNTTGTGVPSIAIAGTDYVLPGGAGAISGLTLDGALYAASANTIASTAAMTNGQILIGSTGAAPVKNTISGTANEITITNGAGTIAASLPTVLTFTGKTVTGGIFAATSFDGPIGSNTPNAGTFTSISSTGNAEVGIGGSGATNASVIINGSSASSRGPDMRFQRNSVDKAFIGMESTILSNNSDSIVIYSFASSIKFINASGILQGEFTSTGLNSAAIGATVPSTGAFTTLATTADVMLSGTAGTGGNGYIFGPPAAGKSLTLQSGNSTGQIFIRDSAGLGLASFSTTGQAFRGTTTNDDAGGGFMGEYVSSTIASGSAVSVTTATTTNVTSISMTAGDWDVSAVGKFNLTAASASLFSVGVSTTSATLPGDDAYVQKPLITSVLTSTYADTTPVVRLSLASTTTVYLVVRSTFSVGTETAYGTIRARRVR